MRFPLIIINGKRILFDFRQNGKAQTLTIFFARKST